MTLAQQGEGKVIGKRKYIQCSLRLCLLDALILPFGYFISFPPNSPRNGRCNEGPSGHVACPARAAHRLRQRLAGELDLTRMSKAFSLFLLVPSFRLRSLSLSLSLPHHTLIYPLSSIFAPPTQTWRQNKLEATKQSIVSQLAALTASTASIVTLTSVGQGTTYDVNGERDNRKIDGTIEKKQLRR